MPRQVVVVFERDFRSRLRAVAFKHPVWIAETPENRAAAEDLWSMAQEWPHVSVTMFRDVSGSRRDEWRTLLEQIELHHGAALQRGAPYDTLEIIGIRLEPAARAALWDAGFQQYEETADGFRARRAKPSTPSRSSS